MLDVALARKLIERVTEYTSYNVNIMDENGVIIASRNPERIGSFHEAAYQVLHGKKDIINVEFDDEYPGVLRGINMVIDIDGEREGVVGVTGDPEEIRPVALIMKMAIETMIKYENQKLQSLRRQTRKERFAEILTHEEKPDPNYIRELAKELKYREDLIRIPILCQPSRPRFLGSLLEKIKNSDSHSSEDISFILEDKYILIFKTLAPSVADNFSDYKYIIADYLRNALRWLREEELGCRFFVGTFQNNLTQYYYAYRHCRWLLENILHRQNSGDPDRRPLDALRIKNGGVYDTAILFCALARAAGIPAVPVAGILIDIRQTAVPHWWAEFYIENFGWVPVDPGMAAGIPYVPVHNETEAADWYFGNIDGNRVAFSRGWTYQNPMTQDSKTVGYPRSFSFQKIWEETNAAVTGYTSFWNTPRVTGVY